MIKRIIALLLVTLTCLSLFACGSNPEIPGSETTASNSGNQTTADTKADTKADTTTEVQAKLLTIIADGKTEYKVIRPENAGADVVNAAANLRLALADATGAKITIDSDWHKKTETLPEKAKEIVVGHCDRPDSDDIYRFLRLKDFTITYSNERIFIMGGGDEATVKAVEYFIENFIDKANKSVSVMDNLKYMEGYTYPLGTVSVNGTMITDYTIVIPSGCDPLTSAAAQNLSDYFFYNGGIRLTTVTDKEAATEYEILVGNTNRSESSKATSVSLDEGQYVLGMSGSKIVMYGKDYMIGGAVSEFINKYAVSPKVNEPVDVTNLPTSFTASTFKFEKADSAVLLICDGMGFNHIGAAVDTGKINEFVANQLPNKGQVITASYSVQIGKKGYTDSAAAGTALATGYKTINGYLGLNSKGASVQNIRELAASKGAKTAILSTDYITGATPAAFLTHVPDRDLTEQIQKQIDKLVENGDVNYAISNKDSDAIINDIPGALWGISEGGSGFFSMIEEADCDKRAHKNLLGDIASRVARYNSIVSYCVEFAICHPKSVVIITADHETGGLTYNESTKTYSFTSTNHTNSNVPVFAIGDGTECFNNTTVDNTDIPKFMAKLYGVNNFGA